MTPDPSPGRRRRRSRGICPPKGFSGIPKNRLKKSSCELPFEGARLDFSWNSTWMLTTAGRTRFAIAENSFSIGMAFGINRGVASGATGCLRAAPTSLEINVPMTIPIVSVNKTRDPGSHLLSLI